TTSAGRSGGLGPAGSRRTTRSRPPARSSSPPRRPRLLACSTAVRVSSTPRSPSWARAAPVSSRTAPSTAGSASPRAARRTTSAPAGRCSTPSWTGSPSSTGPPSPTSTAASRTSTTPASRAGSPSTGCGWASAPGSPAPAPAWWRPPPTRGGSAARCRGGVGSAAGARAGDGVRLSRSGLIPRTRARLVLALTYPERLGGVLQDWVRLGVESLGEHGSRDPEEVTKALLAYTDGTMLQAIVSSGGKGTELDRERLAATVLLLLRG